MTKKPVGGNHDADEAGTPLVTITGRLEELNGREGLTGRLWEADGTKWLCRFKPEHFDVLVGAWMRPAQAVGCATIDEDGSRVLDVDSLKVLDDAGEEASPGGDSFPFWTPLSLDELARRQGVRGPQDLDRIGSLWPVDDDPDELLRHVLSERETQRRISREDRAS